MAKTTSSLSGAAHTVAVRYAGALIETAAEAGVLESVEKDMIALGDVLADSSDLQSLISNPVFGRDQQLTAILAIAAKTGLNKITSNFLGVITMNGRLYAIGAIITVFKKLMSGRRGEVKALVKSAFPLSAEQERALQDTLKKSLGFNVQLDISVDRDLLGGMIVTVGSRMIDDSLKGKLDRLKLVMQSQSNQNIKLGEVG